MRCGYASPRRCHRRGRSPASWHTCLGRWWASAWGCSSCAATRRACRRSAPGGCSSSPSSPSSSSPSSGTSSPTSCSVSRSHRPPDARVGGNQSSRSVQPRCPSPPWFQPITDRHPTQTFLCFFPPKNKIREKPHQREKVWFKDETCCHWLVCSCCHLHWAAIRIHIQATQKTSESNTHIHNNYRCRKTQNSTVQ